MNDTEDLAGEKPEVIAKMSKALEAWADSLNKSKTGADYNF
jgi:hypothetical protein